MFFNRSESYYDRSTENLLEMVDPITGRRKKRKRLFEKNGRCSILQNYTRQHFRFLTDIFTTLVDIKWRYNLTVFTFVYLLGWVGFGVIWWLVALEHGDLAPEQINNPEWKPCVSNVYSFPTAFLFSVETQTTIGYGYRSITDECWIGIIVVVIQSVFSCVIDAVMIGCVFAKIAKPKRRAETLVFSKHAVIALRDSKLTLMFQVADMRHNHLFEAHVRAKLIKHRTTEEGELIPLYQYDLNVGYDMGLDRIFLVWPLIIEHVIDNNSPLYDVTASGLKHASFEIIVILEGIVPSTGMTTQKLTSYLPEEVKWGFRFDHHILTLHNEHLSYVANYDKLNNTIAVPTPSMSMKELDLKREASTDEATGNCTTEHITTTEPAKHKPENETHCKKRTNNNPSSKDAKKDDAADKTNGVQIDITDEQTEKSTK